MPFTYVLSTKEQPLSLKQIESMLSAMGSPKTRAVFVFPGSPACHTPGIRLSDTKPYEGPLKEIVSDMPYTASLPMVDIMPRLNSEALTQPHQLPQKAILDLWFALGAGFTLVLPGSLPSTIGIGSIIPDGADQNEPIADLLAVEGINITDSPLLTTIYLAELHGLREFDAGKRSLDKASTAQQEAFKAGQACHSLQDAGQKILYSAGVSKELPARASANSSTQFSRATERDRLLNDGNEKPSGCCRGCM